MANTAVFLNVCAKDVKFLGGEKIQRPTWLGNLELKIESDALCQGFEILGEAEG